MSLALKAYHCEDSNILTAAQRKRFDELCAIVAASFEKLELYSQTLAEALLEIHNERLYRETHATWKAFCEDERMPWKKPITRQRGYQLLDFGKMLSLRAPTTVDTPAYTERQARKDKKAFKDDPDWKAFNDEAAQERLREKAQKLAEKRQAAEEAKRIQAAQEDEKTREMAFLEKIVNKCDALLKALSQRDSWEKDQVGVRRTKAKAQRKLMALMKK